MVIQKDSLVDSGDNDYLLTLSRANWTPYGIDFKPSGGQPTGRFTDGRPIADIVGQALREESFPPPFLAPNREHATSRGINYASGASGILDETGSLFVIRSRSSQFGSINYILKRSIFSLTIGSNDIINYILPSVPYFSAQKLLPTMYQSFHDLQFDIAAQGTKSLREMGARKLVVVEIGPVGCKPFVRALNLFLPGRSCVIQVNQFIQGYNKKLKELLDKLNREGSREAVFIYVNSYDISMEVALNYRRHGFKNANALCRGGFLLPFDCYNATSVMCDDRSKYVFWDAYGPTEAANAVVAQELLDGDQTRSYPHQHSSAVQLSFPQLV